MIDTLGLSCKKRNDNSIPDNCDISSDKYINPKNQADKEKYFTVGMEEESGRYYVSIPVSNSKADYEEYYWIDASTYENHKSDLSQLEYIADECRNRLRDKDLIFEPGSERGIPI